MKNVIMAVFAALLMIGTASANPHAKKHALASCCKSVNCCPPNTACCKGDASCCDGSTDCVCQPKADGTCVCIKGSQAAGKVAKAQGHKGDAKTASCCKKRS